MNFLNNEWKYNINLTAIRNISQELPYSS
jgi:hypothetical protein